jgi:peptidoglycan/LPS O-acetylase OafA/YrhL
MKRLELLDIGRFAATIAVMCYHYFYNGIANGKVTSIDHIPELIVWSKYGYLGVDFFFMISGYVISTSSINRSASEFAISRAQRIYPAFWFAVLFTSVITFFWGNHLMNISLNAALVNLTMIPNFFGFDYVDGVYWTLKLELIFYVSIFLILILKMQKYFDLIFFIWPFAILLAKYFGKSEYPLLNDYYSFFAAGALFSLINTKQPFKRIISLIVSFYLCASFAIQVAMAKQAGQANYIVFFIISLFFIYFIFLNKTKGMPIKINGSKTLGALTYPIYLIHAHFGYMFLNQYASNDNRLKSYMTLMLLVFFTSYLIHYFIEKKLSLLWKMLFTNTIGKAIQLIEKKLKV